LKETTFHRFLSFLPRSSSSLTLFLAKEKLVRFSQIVSRSRHSSRFDEAIGKTTNLCKEDPTTTRLVHYYSKSEQKNILCNKPRLEEAAVPEI
jgi:hypothetical protein